MPTPQYEPNVPMPYTTKGASKRRKHSFRIKGFDQTGMRKPNPVRLIYGKNTNAIVADDATEARLNRTKYTAPETSRRYDGMQVKW